MKRISFIAIITFILLASFQISIAATYTVCAAGCNASTIQGAFNTLALGSDDILEVQADSPGGSKTYNETVKVSGNGTLGHPVIFRARNGDTITIDSLEAVTGGSTIYVNADHFTVDGFNVRGAQGPQIFAGYIGSGTTRNAGITIRNCQIHSASALGNANHEGIMVNRADGTLLLNNTITTTSAYQGANDTDCFYASNFDGLIIDGNNCTISTGNGVAQPHNDGIQVSGGNGINFQLGSARNLTIKNNTFLHNSNRVGFKQCIYVEYEVQGYVQIYNNVCRDTLDANTNIVSVYNKGYGTQGVVSIFNNSIFVNGAIASAIVADEGCPNPYVKNNAVLWNGANDYQCCISVLSTSQVPAQINYNSCYKNGGTVLRNKSGSIFYTFTNWQAAGYDINGYNLTPAFVNVSSPPYDLHLQSSSWLIDHGIDNSIAYTGDIASTSRPQCNSWDIGAYESLVCYSGKRPNSPINLSIK